MFNTGLLAIGTAQKISRTCSSCITETCLEYCKTNSCLQIKKKKNPWLLYIETYLDAKRYYITGFQALSGSRPLFMMTLDPSLWLLPCPLIIIICFRLVPPLYSLLCDSDISFHNLMFLSWLITNIKSLFPLHWKHYFWDTAGAQK